MVKSQNSDHDSASAIKDAHDPIAHALRVRDANSRVPSEYSKVVFEKTIDGSITEALFYRGETAQKTRFKFVDDVAGSLNGTYFEINTAEDAVQYYVWYNNGLGVDPAVPNKVGFEIPYITNDSASLITLATKRYFFETCEHFKVEPNGLDVLLVENVVLGQTTATTVGTTPFTITTIINGITQRICTLTLEQVPEFKYFFNEAERCFVVSSTQSLSGTVDVNVISPLPLPVSFTGVTVAAGAVQNIDATTKNTEYTFSLAVGVKRFEIKSRLGSRVKFSFIVGQSGIEYRTIEAGCTYYERDLILTVPLDFYFQSGIDNDVLEVVTYS